jgi:hypothetical protein
MNRNLLQYGRDFRNWPEATTASSLKEYREGLKAALTRCAHERRG